jgi:hypothetical protein
MDKLINPGKVQVAPSTPPQTKLFTPVSCTGINPTTSAPPPDLGLGTTVTSTLFASKIGTPLRKQRENASKFEVLAEDVTQSAHFVKLADRNVDAENHIGDYIAYKVENLIAADANYRFYILLFSSIGACFFFAIAWDIFITPSDDVKNAGDSLFMVFQLLITGGYDNGLEKLDQRICFFFVVSVGVVLISTLIGLISDSVKIHMESLTEGTTKVVEKGHTVILGWNDSTIRVLVQIAHLRSVYQRQNNSWKCFFFPWLKTVPSSPVVSSTVVVLNDTVEKTEMESLLLSSFQATAISKKETKIGKDIIFRKGNPNMAHDLVRVGAQNATAILVMMTAEDKLESEIFPTASTDNSSTIRTVLALRNVILANGDPKETFNNDLRIVVELDSPCPFIDEVFFVTPTDRQVLYPQNLQRNINSILFYCASKPGLSRVLVSLYNFEGVAIRCRKVKDLKGGDKFEKGWFCGKTVHEAQLANGWGNGIVIGCDDKNLNYFDEEDDDDGYNAEGAAGIMGDPQRVLSLDDTLIFVSETSSPQIDKSSNALSPTQYAEEAAPFLNIFKKQREVTSMFSGGSLRGSENATLEVIPTKPLRVLLCGWRMEWDIDGKSFKERVKDIGAGMAEGSVITCVNTKTLKSFGSLLEEVGFEVSEDVSSSPSFQRFKRTRWELKGSLNGVYVEHFKANCVKYEEMEPLFEVSEYHTAICLGSVVGADLSNHVKDARVLSMLLILRKLSRKQGTPLNIIAENCQDQTSGLAMVPLNRARDADFVNTTAIKSRSLVMNLAYPEIQDALSELIVSIPNTPEVGFIEVAALGILNERVRNKNSLCSYFVKVFFFLNYTSTTLCLLGILWSSSTALIRCL